MALPTISASRTDTDFSSSVHHKETSVQIHPGQTYREKLLINCEAEYAATKISYEQMDGVQGKDRVGALDECRTGAWYAIHLQSGLVRVLSSSCRLRWCPMCASARSRLLVANLSPWLKRSGSPKFLTLTLKHSDDTLWSQIERLYRAFQKLRTRVFIKRSIRAGVWFFQITWSEKSQQWHPHLHCVLDADYMPQKKLRQLWLSVTDDSNIVDIRAVRDPVKVAEYVAKYAARPCSLAGLNNLCRLQLLLAMHNRRLCGKWGDCGDLVLSAKPVSIEGEYVVVCHYSKLSDLCKISVLAEKIRTAFRDGTVLDACTTRSAMIDAVQAMWDDARPEPPPIVPDPQLKLWDDDCNWQSVYNPGYFGN